jgi:hypothetical protein
MKTPSTNDIWETARELSTKIHQASWIDRDKPCVQYPWVAGYMEGLLKALPRTKENMDYLQGELGYLNKYLQEKA